MNTVETPLSQRRTVRNYVLRVECDYGQNSTQTFVSLAPCFMLNTPGRASITYVMVKRNFGVISRFFDRSGGRSVFRKAATGME
jgi:hypothetical protein